VTPGCLSVHPPAGLTGDRRNEIKVGVVEAHRCRAPPPPQPTARSPCERRADPGALPRSYPEEMSTPRFGSIIKMRGGKNVERLSYPALALRRYLLNIR
ncbi:MAG: hypothetical protein M3160_10200, partial [Candidatus Eremiobacteraeota bacterium]|nr:hypothetical protein [Candidatus Eremiobacteraeota bacterium]